MPRYARFGVEMVTEFYYSYRGFQPCDSTALNVQLYNKKGQLTKERFPRSRMNNYYTYEYNEEGFLIDIDSIGFFGYGSASGRFEDTSYEEIQECWIRFDTTRRLVQSVRYYSDLDAQVTTDYEYDDSTGRLCRSASFEECKAKIEFIGSSNYEYDSNGFLLKKIFRDEEETITAIHEFVYVYRQE
jgi:hypothetical protein